MESSVVSRRARKYGGEDLSGVLRKSWCHLRLSVRHPSRVRTWDAIVLTAASPEQAALYEWQLARAKRMGRIASSSITLAVPDPEGARIGSGAATLHAISALARHLRLGVDSHLVVPPFMPYMEKFFFLVLVTVFWLLYWCLLVSLIGVELLLLGRR